MGRRSDHSREQLRAMIVAAGHRQMAQVGFARFSAREVAKQIGYSVGTLYNVFGSFDQLILAINGETLDQWRHHLETRLADATEDRLHRAIQAYFEFAILHEHAWTAIYDFRLPATETAPPEYQQRVRDIFDIVVCEIEAELPPRRKSEAAALARSLLATVHGHCYYTLTGTFRLLEEPDPLGAAYARVREAMAS
jgi:AcrR family transcriptional regulator